jgi:hypothetical protein
LSKASLKKKESKEKDPKGKPKTLMPPMGVHKLNGGKNLESNLERDQTTHLQGWIIGLTKLNWGEK